ncbi:MAG: hypothetical protein QM626_12510 [Microbacterium sp.]|uniref:DsbA family protein n=1 Tax=Microbacterium sp. TaxID=51671 RepID=UPI0039E4AA95
MAKTRLDRSWARELSKKERRELQREYAREERERAAIARRRRRIVGWIVGPTAAVVVLAIVVVVVVAQVRDGMRGPQNMLSDGLLEEGSGDGSTYTAASTAALAWGDTPTVNTSDVASTGVLDIQLYLDPTDTASATFWSTNASSLVTYLEESAVTVELHPVAFGNSDAGIAAVAAFGCVADTEPDVAWDYLAAMLTATAAGSPPSSDTLLSLATSAGVTGTDTQKCITDGGFRSWAADVSTRAAESVPYAEGLLTVHAVSDSPVIVAAGQTYSGAMDDSDAFTSFLGTASSSAG